MQGIKLAQFAKPEKQVTVCTSWNDFITRKTFVDFEKLIERREARTPKPPEAAPYLKILPAATAALLKGLKDYAFEEKPRVVKVKAKVTQSEPDPAWTATGTVSVSEGQADLFADEQCANALAPLTAGALAREVEFYVRGKPSGGVKRSEEHTSEL